MKYTLYHIKGDKWGCTRLTLKQRFLGHDYRKKGLTVNDVCETEVYYDEHIAADREKQLNLRDGYSWEDKNDYRAICKLTENQKGKPRSEETKLKTSGSKHHNAKLTESDVLEIRSKYIPKLYTQQKLANEYRVSKINIKCITSRRTWTHI